jgi:hypothetical protein
MKKKEHTPEEAISKFLIIHLNGEEPRLLGFYKTKQEKEDTNRIPHWLNKALPKKDLEIFGIQSLIRVRANTQERPCLDWVKMEVHDAKTFKEKFPNTKMFTVEELFQTAEKARGENGNTILKFDKRKPAIAAIEVLQTNFFYPAAPNFNGEKKKGDPYQIDVSFIDFRKSPFADLVSKIDWRPSPQNLQSLRKKASVNETPSPSEERCFATHPKEDEKDFANMVRWLRLLTDIDIQAEKGIISYPRGSFLDLRKIFPGANIPDPPAIQKTLF